jgi:glycosyltransferase involved in cell wall biosynthesis
MASGDERAGLNILHVFRAPVGGLFRHVVDLARGQAVRGHRVGLIADSSTGGAQAEATLERLARELAFGVTRIPMSRHIGVSDVPAVSHVTRRASDIAADVIHGHGGKGGAYARLAKSSNKSSHRSSHAIRVYTPHGGSLHYHWASPVGFFYLAAERALMPRTDLFLFESAYGRDIFRAKVGDPRCPVEVVHNGVTAAEFEPIVTDAGATDLVFIGELRALKGVDVLIRAIAQLAPEGRGVTATIVGAGPDQAAFQGEVAALGLDATVRFVGVKPARVGFSLGRISVVPSRAESLPYIVLEAAAAGRPLIATNVGGIPEIFGPDAGELVPPDDPAALAHAIGEAVRDPVARAAAAGRLKARVAAAFSADVMTDAVLAAYGQARARARRNG